MSLTTILYVVYCLEDINASGSDGWNIFSSRLEAEQWIADNRDFVKEYEIIEMPVAFKTL